MKKTCTALLLACALALGLMPKLPASATIIIPVPPASTYTLTIPSTVNVANSGKNETSGISATGSLASNEILVVTASSGDEFALVSGENKISYSLVKEESEPVRGNVLRSAAAPSWTFDSLSATEPTTQPLAIDVQDYSDMPAGEYTDTVTFTAVLKTESHSGTIK